MPRTRAGAGAHADGPPALSGCLIVRDNAKTIGPCLESLRPWVDELVVVDTGSTDDTPRLAAALGARVFHFPWVDDFSAARNESVRHARGEWVFWMDSDDVIDAANGRALRTLADGPHPDTVFGYVVRVHCTGPDPALTDDVTVVDHVKLFRNRPDLRFEHRIHEQIIPAIRRAGGGVAWTDLFVVHAGYDHSPEGQARKKERDLRILHRELAEKPGHPFTLFNLGMTYADVGEPGRAAGYLEESLRASVLGDSQRRKAYALLAFCRAALGDAAGALRTCDAGLAECPEDVELRFRAGVYLHATGRLREAVAAYERVLAGGGPRYFTSLDRGVAGFKARANLAAVHADLGEWDPAERLLRAVTAEEPNYRPGWQGLGDLLLRRGRLDAAGAVAAELVGRPRLAAEGHLLAGRVAVARGRADDAGRAWEAALALGPTEPDVLERLARLAFEAGRDGPAERALRALAAAAPTDGAVHHNLGTVFLHARGRARPSPRSSGRSSCARTRSRHGCAWGTPCGTRATAPGRPRRGGPYSSPSRVTTRRRPRCATSGYRSDAPAPVRSSFGPRVATRTFVGAGDPAPGAFRRRSAGRAADGVTGHGGVDCAPASQVRKWTTRTHGRGA
ncbi:glycosyltransferase [Frigoriglobus tundricola]|uniref:glycosyltransferase n=1 Tax=Frigoriglobus tundricola TaxID=2774151 RepID=UPI001D074EE8